ncbi:MAG: ComEC/Rec2 family competence protein [Bryobacteraceae bacterium]|nr:ComEC/Rec2 family competence protein [Bryobacteraceae bacterium]MDW8379446.1 ComEC/Rec2 family competence protein [Bryobacterales bacterium]
MRLRANPLLLPALCLLAGIVTGHALGFELHKLLLLLVCGLLALAFSTYRLAYLCVFILSLGVFLACWRRPGPRPALPVESGSVVMLEGCVVAPPAWFENRVQFILELAPGARVQVSFYFEEDEKPPRIAYGQRLEVQARLRQPRNFENPGSFDYEAYLARRKIFWTATVRRGAAPRLLGDCGNPWQAALYHTRALIFDRLEQLYADDPYTAAMLQALLVGDSSRLERVWVEDFRRTGTYHAIVISGLHLTIVAAVLVPLLSVVVRRRTSAQLLAALLAWAYVGICGWQIPLMRAAAGFTLFAIGRFFFRGCRPLNLLAAVVVIFLLADPESCREASFQFSFLSVLALAALASPALEASTTRLRQALHGLLETDRDLHLEPHQAQFRIELRLIAETLHHVTGLRFTISLGLVRLAAWCSLAATETVLVSLAVQLGLALPVIFYFHRLSLTAVTANLLVTPLLTLAVPVGFLAALTGWPLPVWLAQGLVHVSGNFARWHAAREPNWLVPDPPWWLATAFVVSLGALALLGKRLLFIPTVSLLALIVWHPFPPQSQARVLEVTMIDVGQGESLLVGFPDGQWMIVDGGGIPSLGKTGAKPRLDIGEDVVTPYLLSRSIRRVDYIANTHQHDDHAAGLLALIRNFKPRELWVGATPESESWSQLQAEAQRQSIRIRSLRKGHTQSIGPVMVRVLAPPVDYQPKWMTPTNHDSLVLRLDYGETCFLLTGDLERPGEVEMLEDLKPCQVLKVAHHGSRTSSTDSLLDALHPSFALISAGEDNFFRHPHPSVLERLRQRHIQVYRTDRHGLVTLRSDGRRISVERRLEGRRSGPLAPF